MAWALYRFDRRLTALGLRKNGRVPLPFRQQDMADALGLSLVHTNKTLAKLRTKGLAHWAEGWLSVADPDGLAEMAHIDPRDIPTRPLI